MKSVSLNGPDGSGKTQQLSVLAFDCGDFFHFTKHLSSYSYRWPDLQGVDFSNWWFSEVSTDELMEICIESLNNRNKDCPKDRIAVLDRGWLMWKSVCVATLITRNPEISIEEAMALIDARFRGRLDYSPQEAELLLVPDENYQRSIAPYLGILYPRAKFPDPVERRYERYQHNLREAIAGYFPQSTQRVVVNCPILSVQNKVRQHLNSALGIQLPFLAEGISSVVGLGGMSESGKSSFAEHLRKNYAFCRLKLRYFIEMIEKRNEVRTNEGIVFELLLFLKRHYYIDRVTIESLQDPFVPSFLKLMLGDRFKVLFIDVDEKIRVERAVSQRKIDSKLVVADIRTRDQEKLGRGAMRVKDIADAVIDNSHGTLRDNLDCFTSLIGIKQSP